MWGATLSKRLLVGRPMASNRLGETLLPKWLALPIFCSDALSSVAYATESILVALSAGGLAFLAAAPWITVVVAVVLVVVVASYRQTCRAYPRGGGSYIVSHENLGPSAGLVAAAALLVDYVMTVAVSIVAGTAAITSAIPEAAPHTVAIAIGLVVVLTVVNLRGLRETGTVFAAPTYGFVVMIFVMFGWAATRSVTGGHLVAESAGLPVLPTEHVTGLLALLLVLRAFAQGCTALTGVEAISNGVPVFRAPRARNAATTLSLLAALAVSMGVGITILAVVSGVHTAADPSQLGLPAGATPRTVLAQVAAAVFGDGSIGFYALQALTAGILVLAANTSFNGFPVLASILARDRYLPRQFYTRGDRLVFSNGIVLLALFAIILIWAFDANVNALIQLYVVGVFIAFTLSQLGMVRHWQRQLAEPDAEGRAPKRRAQAINAVGAVATGTVLVVVLVTKFLDGAWIVVVAVPVLVVLMRAVSRHYATVAGETALAESRPLGPSRNHVIVLVASVNGPTLRALAYARFLRPDTLAAVTVPVDDDPEDLRKAWDAADTGVALTVLDSPYREITRPILKYVKDFPRRGPRDVVTVVIPEYVVGHWWEQLLHNQSALRLKARLLFQPSVVVIDVPWHLRSAAVAPLPGG
ncbi:APC family permease [Actinomycetospora chiangmaiensis]|uniref:APC family permease n=1 Tax=Actinomycetospora chiangmaiensis TaxID=402650 RepID=UPI000362CAEB|nr:APC family permease [Actinomycetospora chiangmaiensis]